MVKLTTKQAGDISRAVALSNPVALAHEFGKARELPDWVAPDWIKYVAKHAVLPIIRNIKRGTGPTRLILEAPVRHGKTLFFGYSVPAWFLMLEAASSYIIATHTESLAIKHARFVRDALVLNGPSWVGWQPVGGKNAAAGDWSTPYGGGMLARGIGGAWSGFGANIIYVDDPYKNAQEARSQVRRKAIWDWFKGDVLNRLEPNAGLIVAHARWHTDDLIGRLKKEKHEDPDWITVTLPAIAQPGDQLGRAPGEPLWPDRWGLEQIAKRRAEITDYYWRALWQQVPSDDASAVFKESNLREWRWSDGQYFTPDGVGYRPEELSHFAICDTAKTVGEDSDFTVLTTFAVAHKDDGLPLIFVVDCVRRQLESPNIVPLITERLNSERLIEFVGIEGKEICQYAMAEGIRKAREVIPIGDKQTRAVRAATAWENHRVFMPPNDWAPWVDDFTAELFAFPVGSHDDQVDTLAYAAKEVERFYVGA